MFLHHSEILTDLFYVAKCQDQTMQHQRFCNQSSHSSFMIQGREQKFPKRIYTNIILTYQLCYLIEYLTLCSLSYLLLTCTQPTKDLVFILKVCFLQCVIQIASVSPLCNSQLSSRFLCTPNIIQFIHSQYSGICSFRLEYDMASHICVHTQKI